ncbi:MAG: hypothetical protein ACRDJW_25430 [Thermomicrobiales bacterium]
MDHSTQPKSKEEEDEKMMTEHKTSTIKEAAGHLIDTLMAGGSVTLEVTAQDRETGELLRLVTAIHAVAQERRVRLEITPIDAQAIRLSLGSG